MRSIYNMRVQCWLSRSAYNALFADFPVDFIFISNVKPTSEQTKSIIYAHGAKYVCVWDIECHDAMYDMWSSHMLNMV